MKPTFKTTALSLLVALGVAACGSNSGSGGEQPAKSNITPSTKHTEKPFTSNPNQTNSSQAENTTSTKPAENKPNNQPNSKDTSNKEFPQGWRKVRLGAGAQNNEPTGAANQFFYSYPSQIIDLEKLNTPILGTYSGTIDSKQYPAFNLQKANGTTEKVAVDKIHYLYVNQPYTSYGMLYANVGGENMVHPITLGTYLEMDLNGNQVFDGKDIHINADGSLVERLRGNATYKGNVIASKDNNMPEIDGALTMNVNFNKFNATVNGEIESKKLGKIQLNNGEISHYDQGVAIVSNATSQDNQYKGHYSATFLGKDFAELMGTVDLRNSNYSSSYQAAYGATKQ